MTKLISFEKPVVLDHGSIADHTFAQGEGRRRRQERRRRREGRWGEHPAAS